MIRLAKQLLMESEPHLPLQLSLTTGVNDGLHSEDPPMGKQVLPQLAERSS